VASLSQGRTAAAQCGLFTHKSVPVIFEPPCNLHVTLNSYTSPPSDQVNKTGVNTCFRVFRVYVPSISRCTSHHTVVAVILCCQQLEIAVLGTVCEQLYGYPV